MAERSPEEDALWGCVTTLWALSKDRDGARIRALLHADYVGWDMSAAFPHNREAAVHSVTGAAPALRDYALRPLSVRVYDGHVGVVHYAYTATVAPKNGAPVAVSGKWSEVYLRQGGTWTLLSVSGRPDPA